MRVLYEPETGQRVPVRIWARSVGLHVVRQLQLIASQPYVVEHVAAMPDAHVAEGVAVGTVFGTEQTVVPAALGGDIGCGMRAIRLEADATAIDRRDLAAVLAALARVIPVGDAANRRGGVPLPGDLDPSALSTRSLARIASTGGPRHLGTLGGGNHFLELERDPAGGVWVVLHSGSRGIGAAVRQHHGCVAEATGKGALAGLDVEAAEGRAYLADVSWTLAFARANRDALLRRALEVIHEVLGVDARADTTVDLHHNFVAREVHFGRSLLIHRKGAIHAPDGALGIVPGSMGTASYIVRGRGEPAAFSSCSHGAGRVMTRREARARIAPRALEHAMRRVVFDRERAGSLVEEAPSAYRDVREVLEDEADLATPILRLEPLAVLKG